MPDQPSWRSSTLSQLAVASVGTYLIACVVLGVIVAVTGADPALINIYTSPLRWAAEVFGVSYVAVRNRKEGNGHEPEKPA